MSAPAGTVRSVPSVLPEPPWPLAVRPAPRPRWAAPQPRSRPGRPDPAGGGRAVPVAGRPARPGGGDALARPGSRRGPPAASAVRRERGRRGRISLLEGANRFDPYRVAEEGRPLGVDPEAVLEGIHIARAFTAYQLVALADGWAKEARHWHPTLLVGHELPLLFESEEVPEAERAPLLTHVARALRRTAEATGAPLLLTLAGAGPARFPGLTEHGPRLYDAVRFFPQAAGSA